jgi:hypothetical protein
VNDGVTGDRSSRLALARSILEEWRGFQECILEDVRWRDYGTSLDLVFRCIWKDGDQVFRDDEEPRFVALRLLLVQEFDLHNALNAAQLREPERLNWGVSEVAVVRIHESEDVSMDPAGQFLELECLWEGDRRITARFAAIEAVEL